MKEFISTIKDRDNRIWVYEGDVKGNPIWVMEKDARAMLMTEEDAWKVAKEMLIPEETIIIRKVI